jgi:hypothetical protein
LFFKEDLGVGLDQYLEVVGSQDYQIFFFGKPLSWIYCCLPSSFDELSYMRFVAIQNTSKIHG